MEACYKRRLSIENVHGLQLVLNLTGASEIRRHLFNTLGTEQMIGDDGWKTVIELLESYYKKNDNAEAFDTCNEFRTLCRKNNQTIKDYIMIYEKYKLKMKRCSMDLGERVHGPNLLCGANLQDYELRIATREIDSDDPKNVYKHAKNVLTKYLGKSAITGK